MSEKQNELYILTQKAQKMERINEEIALNIYLEIFENYTPKISKTYESAIRLLEKRERFDEALKICELAIHLIKEDQISGVITKFEEIHERLNRKIAMKAPVLGTDANHKLKFQFKKKFIIYAVIIAVSIILILRLQSPYDELNVNLDGKESIPTDTFDTSKINNSDVDELKNYPLTESMIEIASSEAKKYIEVDDISITLQDNTIGIGLLVQLGTSEARGKEIAESAVIALSGAASATYNELDPPTSTSYGEIYSYYNFIISVGTGTLEENLIAKGSKNIDQKNIYWRIMGSE